MFVNGAQGDVELSVVVPMYDEEAVVDLFLDRLRPVLDGMPARDGAATYEVVCVDAACRTRRRRSPR